MQVMAENLGSSSGALKQLIKAKKEVEESIANARTLKNQWIVANTSNPTNLTKREVNNIAKLFKNKLLTAKWDCEDLEELLNASENELRIKDEQELADMRQFIDQRRVEIASMIKQLDDLDTKAKAFSKHGLNLTSNNQTNAINSLSLQTDDSSKYERLNNNDFEEIQFDKSQFQSANNSRQQATVYTNALYDHLESQQAQKISNPQSQVFSNVSRPVADVYMNSNDNEIILDMLETEFYNPPNELRNRTQLTYALRKLLETDRNKMLGTIAFLFSFPILLVLFLVV